MDDDAAYSRKDSLIMSGNIPDGSRDEVCKSIVSNLLKEQVHVNIDPRDISIAHRVGNKRQLGPDKQNIIFKLCGRDLKYDIINACRQLQPNYYINESLTPTRSKVFYILRQAKNKYSRIKSIRTIEGSISVFISPAVRETSNRVPLGQLRKFIVNTRRQLMMQLEEEKGSSLSELNVEWAQE